MNKQSFDEELDRITQGLEAYNNPGHSYDVPWLNAVEAKNAIKQAISTHIDTLPVVQRMKFHSEPEDTILLNDVREVLGLFGEQGDNIFKPNESVTFKRGDKTNDKDNGLDNGEQGDNLDNSWKPGQPTNLENKS